MTSMPAAFGEVSAAPFPKGLDWINSGRPLTFDDMRGRLLILHFWTYA